MAIKPKGDFEVLYGGPWTGIDYSRPYNTIDPSNLAPGSVNTQQISGFLTSSPWIAGSPYPNPFAANEIVLGVFPIKFGFFSASPYVIFEQVLVVTNIAVYTSGPIINSVNPVFTQQNMVTVHTWAPGDIDRTRIFPGSVVTFVQLNGNFTNTQTAQIFFTAQWLQGVWALLVNPTGANTFQQATPYVCGNYIIELNGRLVIGETRFPTGGGPIGNGMSATVAWSGVGSYIGSGATDPWNPANFATLNGNVGGFNELTDCPDLITGLAGIGRSAIIYRNWGLTEMDPGPSGIDPFLFYHLWASSRGIGAWPNTVAQYGSMAYGLADDNVYAMSLQGGLTAVGTKIIGKIKNDMRQLGFTGGLGRCPNALGQNINFWMFASIVQINGQLHYLLSLNAVSTTLPPPLSVTTTFFATIYDYNIAEDAWHIWDLTQYTQQGATGPGFLTLSHPITQCADAYGAQAGIASGIVDATTPYLMFGAYTAYNGANAVAGGLLFQAIAFDYDVNTNPFNLYWADLYPLVSLPITTMKFRGEVVQLGHQISMRRLRLQAQMAPFPSPTPPGNAQQQLQVTFEGSSTTPVKAPPLNVSPTPKMTTYYGDVGLKDDMIQASISSVVGSVSLASAWNTMPMIRLSSVSIIGNDEQGSTQ